MDVDVKQNPRYRLPLSTLEKVKIIAMWEAGNRPAEIGRAIGRPAKTVSNAVYRIVKESAERGIILKQKTRKQICQHCGKEFEVIVKSDKKYCSDACSKSARIERLRKLREQEELLGPDLPYREPPKFDGIKPPTFEEIAVKVDKHRTKWGAIAAKCEALGLSYGEAVSRGLL